MEIGVSIIIITMNRAKELRETIELLKKQKCNCLYEVLIVDQASTDETQEWFSTLEYPFRYVRLEKNYGVSGGRNKGANLSKYEYMIFLDDDANFVEHDAVEKIYLNMSKSKSNMFAFQILNLSGGLYNWPYSTKLKAKKDENFDCGTFIGCGHGIKKTFFNNVKGYSDNLFFWGEESELVMKSIGYDGCGVEYDGEIVVIHRVEGNGRNTYDAKRFYYQVRNRMYLCKELVPRIDSWYRIYFILGYFFKALKKGWMRGYILGMRDYKSMSIQYDNKLTHKQFLKYIQIFRRR
jgi:GT2 family glycosyltransferase